MLALPHIALCLLAAQATAAVRDESGSDNPVAKVISLLEDMKKKVEDEGKAEAKTYDEFACFCKDNTKKKSDAITKSSDEIDSLSASIQESVAKQAEKGADLAERKESQEEMFAQLTDEQTRCLKEITEFEAGAADLTKAVKSLTKAVEVMKKKAQGASLAEVGRSIGGSLALADALSLVKPSKRSSVQALLQQSVDPTSPGYKFHSGEIVKTLEDLLKGFTDKKTETEKEWKKAKTACDSLKKTFTGKLKANEEAMKKLKDDIEKLKKKAAQDRESLAKEDGLLKESQLYLQDLTQRCEARATDWDQRSDMRGKELQALTEALTILKDGKDGKASVVDMDKAVNKRSLVQLRRARPGGAPARPRASAGTGSQGAGAGEAAAPSFLQAVRGLRGARSGEVAAERAASLLRFEGARLPSGTLSALAMRIAQDPFQKIKTLVQQLIERLLDEAAQEATKKGFCDEELGKAVLVRDFRTADADKLYTEILTLEAKVDGLEKENKELTKNLKDTRDALKKAGEERAKEKKDNLEAIKTAKEGVAAVADAIAILKDFYSRAARAALVQASPTDADTSGPGFSGSYKGSQDDSTGIIGLLEVVKSDFEGTLRKTEESEEAAAAAFVKFDQTSKESIGGMETTMTLNKEDIETSKNTITQNTKDLKTAQDLVDENLKKIAELRAMCDDAGMSFAERKAKRDEEIAALKKALCLLDPKKKDSECA